MDMERKLEEVFTYLFHIESTDYQLHSVELFDEEEKELLATHKQKFIASFKEVKDNISFRKNSA